MERTENNPLSPEDIDENKAAIEGLTAGGVIPDHLDDILEVREKLSESWTEEVTGKNANGRLTYTQVTHHTEVSIDALLDTYKATSGDLDLLASLSDKAQDLVSRLRKPREGMFTSELYKALELYAKRGSAIFDED
jgi:hypothetical protein